MFHVSEKSRSKVIRDDDEVRPMQRKKDKDRKKRRRLSVLESSSENEEVDVETVTMERSLLKKERKTFGEKMDKISSRDKDITTIVDSKEKGVKTPSKIIKDDGASNPSQKLKVRPGPLSKKRKLEEIVSQVDNRKSELTEKRRSPEKLTIVKEKDDYDCLILEPNTPVIIAVTSNAPQSESGKSPNFTSPCPRSKKLSLENTQPPENIQTKDDKKKESSLSSKNKPTKVSNAPIPQKDSPASVPLPNSPASCSSTEMSKGGEKSANINRPRPGPLSKKSGVTANTSPVSIDKSPGSCKLNLGIATQSPENIQKNEDRKKESSLSSKNKPTQLSSESIHRKNASSASILLPNSPASCSSTEMSKECEKSGDVSRPRPGPLSTKLGVPTNTSPSPAPIAKSPASCSSTEMHTEAQKPVNVSRPRPGPLSRKSGVPNSPSLSSSSAPIANLPASCSNTKISSEIIKEVQTPSENTIRPRPGPLSKKSGVTTGTSSSSVHISNSPASNTSRAEIHKEDTKSSKVSSPRPGPLSRKSGIPANAPPSPAKSSASSSSTGQCKESQKPGNAARPRAGPLSRKSESSNASPTVNSRKENLKKKSTDMESPPIVRDIPAKDVSELVALPMQNDIHKKSTKLKDKLLVTQAASQPTHLQELTGKWKDVLTKLEQEAGPLENTDALASIFSTKMLLNLQKTLNENKSLYLFEMALPHIWMDLSLQDLLNCRLVCGRWSKAVDNLLADPPSGEEKSDENDFRTNRPKSAFDRSVFAHRQASTFHFMSEEKIKSFQMKTKNHLRNPFVTRYVTVRTTLEPTDVGLSVHWMSVKELFQMHGQHIWHLQLDIQGYQTVKNTYKAIRRLLDHVQNLRSLELLCQPIDNTEFDEINEVSSLDPLPKLSYLESLDLIGTKIPSSLTSLFIKQFGGTLRNLRVSIYRWNEEDAKLIPNLNQLHITAMCSHENLSHLYTQLQNLQHLNSLRKLSLTVMVRLQASTLFGILQHFQGLRVIKVIMLDHMGEGPHFEDDLVFTNENESPPKLSQIRSLELSFTSSQKSFKFLRWFPSLLSLHLAVSRDLIKILPMETNSMQAKQERIIRHIKRCISKESAIKSSIWSLLPTLQVITLVQPDLYGKKVDLSFTRDVCE